MTKRQKRWSARFGSYGHRVRVYEREVGSAIYYRYREPSSAVGAPRFRKGSLGHTNRARAMQWARQKAEELQIGAELEQNHGAKASMVFALYLQYATPAKAPGVQEHDKRCAELFSRLFGPGFDLHDLDSARWERFKRDRLTGALDPKGRLVREDERRPVRTRTVKRDLEWLRSVVNWARRWREPGGETLMRSNPVEALVMPRENRPRRHVATQDRFEQVRTEAEKIVMAVSRRGWGQAVKTYLPELLDLVNETGRRIGAVRQLKVSDLRLKPTPNFPHGAIVWPADTDKMDREWLTPINVVARAAIDRRTTHLRGDPEAYLFPSPTNPTKPTSKEMADKWLLKAEKLAELEPLDGTLWHAYRRKWASERKHLSRTDTAAAGGWSDVRTLESIYQQADDSTLYEVVSAPKRIRGVR